MNGTYDLYQDMKNRTGGEVYIGVCGPVRTGKSTFIKRFMEEIVLPVMEDEAEKERARDELPQSAGGKTITTTEPKFIPSKAACITLEKDISVKVRLVDCVGYMVDGAAGHMEEEQERMVKTPWSEEPIPFTRAATIGTDKVIGEHSTIGLVITTDGTIDTQLPRENYLTAEEKTIQEMKKQGKPFLVVVNSAKPYGKLANETVEEIQTKYDVLCITMNVQQMKKEDIKILLQKIVCAFPIANMEFYMPKWIGLLPKDHPLIECLMQELLQISKNYNVMQDAINSSINTSINTENEYVKEYLIKDVDLSCGVVKVQVFLQEKYYYEMLSKWFHEPVRGERDLLEKIREYAKHKEEFKYLEEAIMGVRTGGYGMVKPIKEEIEIEKPIVVKHGNRYGVKIKAHGPSVHMIRAEVETEIAPIVGDKEQAEELVRYIEKDGSDEIWNTNIFGKTVLQLVDDGMSAKMARIEDQSKQKLQDSMQKIVNDSNGGMICIII